jgi:hypothetical protein
VWRARSGSFDIDEDFVSAVYLLRMWIRRVLICAEADYVAIESRSAGGKVELPILSL